MNQTATQSEAVETSKNNVETFYNDVIKGLSGMPKRLNSMYFYDAVGDKIFQELMGCPEYYPTNCEMEIFSQKTAALAQSIIADGDAFDLIELGAGDATKSSHLLKYLLEQKVDFTYLPVDISSNIINYLTVKLPLTLPSLQITGLNGEYFEMLKKAAALSNRRKVVLFMGSNIGNMPVAEANAFCKELRNHLAAGDMMVVGFDLKKSPKTILAAYNDSQGITKRFNLNLLDRINRELGSDFEVGQFDHYAMYDPETGACKSYLISQKDQVVSIGKEVVRFIKDEYIYMEISQKFTVMQTDQMAAQAGFRPVDRFFDNKKWFLDTIWMAE
jgi:L-histidine N-alpha-methyltransferase